jgi:hypothetical protein
MVNVVRVAGETTQVTVITLGYCLQVSCECNSICSFEIVCGDGAYALPPFKVKINFLFQQAGKQPKNREKYLSIHGRCVMIERLKNHVCRF